MEPALVVLAFIAAVVLAMAGFLLRSWRAMLEIRTPADNVN
jgi:hypothetical protein